MCVQTPTEYNVTNTLGQNWFFQSSLEDNFNGLPEHTCHASREGSCHNFAFIPTIILTVHCHKSKHSHTAEPLICWTLYSWPLSLSARRAMQVKQYLDNVLILAIYLYMNCLHGRGFNCELCCYNLQLMRNSEIHRKLSTLFVKLFILQLLYCCKFMDVSRSTILVDVHS